MLSSQYIRGKIRLSRDYKHRKNTNNYIKGIMQSKISVKSVFDKNFMPASKYNIPFNIDKKSLIKYNSI